MRYNKVLLIEPNFGSQTAVVQLLADYEVIVATDANSAIGLAHDTSISLIIMELSLAGHSGMEFLYEFRTYSDWAHIPIIVYSTVRLSNDTVASSAWDKLNIYAYLYKPVATLKKLKDTVNAALVTSA